MDHNYYVYILSSRERVLYTGVANDLVRRTAEHKQHVVPGFSRRYNVDQLVYYEHTHNASAAIAREKERKGWVRAKKVALIESFNRGGMICMTQLLSLHATSDASSMRTSKSLSF